MEPANSAPSSFNSSNEVRTAKLPLTTSAYPLRNVTLVSSYVRTPSYNSRHFRENDDVRHGMSTIDYRYHTLVL